MPVFLLDQKIRFPDPGQSETDGLLAIGGDLKPERLLMAYTHGIFPWYAEGHPIMWFSPDPRMLLFPENFKVSKSLKQCIRSQKFQVKFDTQFEQVIESCRSIQRKGESGTWITEAMKQAYIKLHKLGYAHSVESYFDGQLVGGLYGVSLGKAFFGESMFHKQSDASKIALFHLVEKIKKHDFHFIDAQMETGHLKSLGGININRDHFLKLLKKSNKFDTLQGPWT